VGRTHKKPGPSRGRAFGMHKRPRPSAQPAQMHSGFRAAAKPGTPPQARTRARPRQPATRPHSAPQRPSTPKHPTSHNRGRGRRHPALRPRPTLRSPHPRRHTGPRAAPVLRPVP